MVTGTLCCRKRLSFGWDIKLRFLNHPGHKDPVAFAGRVGASPMAWLQFQPGSFQSKQYGQTAPSISAACSVIVCSYCIVEFYQQLYMCTKIFKVRLEREAMFVKCIMYNLNQH